MVILKAAMYCYLLVLCTHIRQLWSSYLDVRLFPLPLDWVALWYQLRCRRYDQRYWHVIDSVAEYRNSFSDWATRLWWAVVFWWVEWQLAGVVFTWWFGHTNFAFIKYDMSSNNCLLRFRTVTEALTFGSETIAIKDQFLSLVAEHMSLLFSNMWVSQTSNSSYVAEIWFYAIPFFIQGDCQMVSRNWYAITHIYCSRSSFGSKCLW